jgi:hypothetical protein
MPRNTSTARLSRSISWSSRRQDISSNLRSGHRRDLVPHQTIGCAQPVGFAQLDGETKQRRVRRIRREGANCDGCHRIDRYHDRARLAGLILVTWRASICRRVSFGPELRDGVDEVLILPFLLAAGHRQRLAMGFSLERRRADIRHPDLNRPQSLAAQALPMRLELVSHCFDLMSGRSWPCSRLLAVTCHLARRWTGVARGRP